MTDKQELIERIRKIFYEETRGKTINEDQKYILDWSEKRLLDAIAQAWMEDVERARLDAEIALARKVIGVSNYAIRRHGVTMKTRLDLLNKEMSRIIPEEFGVITEDAPTKDNDGEGL
jgi:hypothetical protein